MNLLRRSAQYGLVWLSATAMLVAGLPRLGCACLSGQCVASSGAVPSSRAVCCCVPTRRDSAEVTCCRTHHGQTTCCARELVNLKDQFTKGNVAAPRCVDCTEMPEDHNLVPSWSEKDPDDQSLFGGGVSLAHSPSTDPHITQCQAYAPSLTKQALPPIDLITALQRLLI
jgi:hypothetical protein